MKKLIIPASLLLGSLFFIHSGLQSLAGPSLSPGHDEATLACLGEEKETNTTDPEFTESLSPSPTTPEEEIHIGTVRSGGTASRILSPWLTSAQIHDLATASKPLFDLRRLRVGREYRIITTDGTFSRFEYAVDATRFLGVDLDEEGFHANMNAMDFDIEVATIQGSITTSLSEAMKTPEDMVLAVRLGNLFGWEIDFLKDLRQGDTFAVVVEKRFHNETFQGYGNILAAEFVVQGKRFDAYRFEHADGADFYSSSGENLNRMFLKSPVAFTRISSGFSLRRYHPVLKEYRPHYGVDYAAPVGTPIYAAGDGVLLQVTQNPSSGRYVRIRHGNGYETAYLHMSGFARGMRAGKKVKQGELIGYVGQSGFATGPHVCFRMTKDGTPVDPTGIEAPRANPLPEERREEFASLVASLKPQLDIHYARKIDPEKPDSPGSKKSAL